MPQPHDKFARRPDARHLLIDLGLLLSGGAWLALVAATISSRPGQSEAQDLIHWLGGGTILATLAGWAHHATRRLHVEPEPADGARLIAAYSMRRLMALLVASTALPLILLLGFHMLREARFEVEKAGQLVKGLAEVTASDTAAALAEAERVVRYLSERPLVKALDPANCDPYLDELPKLNSHYANVATVDAAGNSVCSVLRSASGARLNIGDPPWFQRLKLTRGFVIGSPQKGVYSGRWIVVLAYPIFGDDGAVAGAAEVVINLAAFQPMVKAALPGGGVAAVIDREGFLIARSEEPEVYVGRNVRESSIGRAVLDSGITSEINVGAGGVERFYAYQAVGRSGWHAVVGVPTELIYTEARHGVWRNGVVGLGVLLLSALLVLVIHRKIADPMKALVGVARRVAEGQLDQRAPESGPVEVVEVAVGFNRMLDTIPVIESELRRSEEQYRALFDASPDAIRVVCDERVVMVNPACVRLFGAESREALLGQPFTASIHPDHRDAAWERVRGVVEQGSAVTRAEVSVVRADGSSVDIEAVILPFVYRGRPAFISISRDLTERKEAERAIRQMNAELESRVRERTAELRRANQSLESFGFTVAHDLRSPLRSMGWFASTLREDFADKLGKDGDDLLGHIVEGVDTMNHLIEGLLAMARLEKVDLSFTEVDLSAIAEVAARELRARDPDRVVDFVLASGIRVIADRRLIKDVIDNLMGNAWKFTARAGHAHIEFGVVRRAGGPAYFVRDNGAGFDPQYADQLFRTFQRLHAAEEFPGTGIGLASVKRIIEHHGGEVWADGAVGEGAVFYFTLGVGKDVASD